MAREIEARLKITAADRTGRVFGQIASKMDHVNRRAVVYNRSQAAISRTAAATLAAMGRFSGPAAVAAGALYATRAAADFEQALFNIQKKSGATTEQMSTLRDEILGLSREMPVSIDEIASAFERGAAAGIPLDELKAFSRLTAGVADAWDSTSEHVGNVFAGFTAGLGMARKDLTAYASLINDLADSGIADETDIADFIDRSGASLKNFGMTPEEIAAYGAALLNLKMPAEVGARAMDTLSGKLLAPENLSPKSHTALVSIVGSMKEFTKLTGNQRLLFFLNRVSSLNNQKRAGLLGALLGEGFDYEVMRLVAGMPELLRNLQMAAKHVENPSNSIVEAQTKRLDLFNSQLKLLQNNLKGIVTTTAEATILPWLGDAMKEVNNALADLDKRRNAVKGQSSEQVKQDAGKFHDDFMRDNPQSSLDDFGSAYDEALKRVGEGRLVDVHEYNIQRREQKAYNERVRLAAEQYQLYGQGRSGVNNVPEFPGGGTGLPPLPLPRPTIMPEQYRILREQYELYGEGSENIDSTNALRTALNTALPPKERRQRLRDADPASLGMEDMGGILIESSRQIEDSGAAAGRSIEDGAAQIKQAGDGFLSGLLDVVRQLNDAAAKIQNVRVAGANMGAQFGRPPVNADTGRTMPPEVGRPGRGPY